MQKTMIATSQDLRKTVAQARETAQTIAACLEEQAEACPGEQWHRPKTQAANMAAETLAALENLLGVAFRDAAPDRRREENGRTYRAGRTGGENWIEVETGSGETNPLGYGPDIFRGKKGFDWGNSSVDSHRAGAAVLEDATGDGRTAAHLSNLFTAEVIVRLPGEGWTLSRDQVMEWVADHPGAV